MKALYLRTVFAFNMAAGGMVAHTAGVINALAKQADLDLISNDPLPCVQVPVAVIKPKIYKILGRSFSEFAYNIKLIFTIQNVGQYNLIYQRHSTASFLGAFLGWKYGKPFVLEYNSSSIWKANYRSFLPAQPVWRFFRILYDTSIWIPAVMFIEKYNLKKAALIVVVSRVIKEELITKGVDGRKILVNPNGVNPEVYFPGAGGLAIREKYRLREEIVVGFSGTFTFYHGVVELASAIILFFEENPALTARVKFFLIGDGDLKPEVEAVISNSPYKERVIFTGLVPQFESPKYLDACDILVSPHILFGDGSEFFGSPIKLFEYMAMGKAIVASKLGQIGEILNHGKTAYLVEPGDINQLAAGIKLLVQDKELRVMLAGNVRQEIMTKYTWDRHVSRILEMIPYKVTPK